MGCGWECVEAGSSGGWRVGAGDGVCMYGEFVLLDAHLSCDSFYMFVLVASIYIRVWPDVALYCIQDKGFHRHFLLR